MGGFFCLSACWVKPCSIELDRCRVIDTAQSSLTEGAIVLPLWFWHRPSDGHYLTVSGTLIIVCSHYSNIFSITWMVGHGYASTSQHLHQSKESSNIGLCNSITARSATSWAPLQQLKLSIFANNSSCVKILAPHTRIQGLCTSSLWIYQSQSQSQTYVRIGTKCSLRVFPLQVIPTYLADEFIT